MAITNLNDFCEAVNSKVESLFPNVGPHEIVKYNDNVKDPAKFTVLVLYWQGATSNSIVKKVCKAWASDGTIITADMTRTEWPTGV